jgi:hypothetical protein
MNVKSCAFLLLGVAAFAAVVDASTKEVTTTKATPVVTKKIVKNNYRSTSRSTTTNWKKVETYNPYVQPMMPPDEVDPNPLLPPHYPPPMLPERRPCGPGGCPRR